MTARDALPQLIGASTWRRSATDANDVLRRRPPAEWADDLAATVADLSGRSRAGYHRWAGLVADAVQRLSVLLPRIDASDTERFKVPSIARDNGHLDGLGDGGDERVVEWTVFGDAVGGQDPRGG